MKLLQTAIKDDFADIIKSWAADICDLETAAFFHIYVPYNSDACLERVVEIRKVLRDNAPGIQVLGCSATGEISGGNMVDDDIVVTLMVFEYPTSRIEVLPYYDVRDEYGIEWVLQHAREIPDLKGIGMVTNAPYEDLENAGRIMDQLPEEIEIFGGVAVGDDKFPSFVFANDCECCSDGTVVVFYSGPELHLQTDRMFGWKPIGYPLTVTRSEGPLVYELDGKPAYEVYNHYFHIKRGDNFFYDALDFPWEVQIDKETKCLRHAKSVNPDGSIVMSSNIPQGSEVKLTYGDPRRIIAHSKQTGLKIRDFAPQVVNIINCMGRKIFWGEKEEIEVREFSKHMKTTGYSALGEIMRYKGKTLLNNLSIVTVAMREGPAGEKIELDIDSIDEENDIPITHRLAIFINTITEELMEKNMQLGEMLYKASHDAMTKLYNRGAIERLIYEADEAYRTMDGGNWYLIMFDIDDFKMINDELGHPVGDKVLKEVARTLSEYVDNLPGVEAGRWGGEEFMLFAEGESDADIKAIADKLSALIKEKVKAERPVTISVGVTRHHTGEDVIDTIDRVDELMYKAKGQGKDQVCSDL